MLSREQADIQIIIEWRVLLVHRSSSSRVQINSRLQRTHVMYQSQLIIEYFTDTPPPAVVVYCCNRDDSIWCKMDELTDTIDRLNTNAQEWVPSSYSKTTTTTTTTKSGGDKSVGKMSLLSSWKLGKEFIPSGYNNNNVSQLLDNTNDDDDDDDVVLSHDGDINNFQDDFHLPWWAQGTSTVPVMAQTSNPNKCSGTSSLRSLGSAHVLWNYYRNATIDTMREMDPNDPLVKAVPSSFVNAYCLDRLSGHHRPAGSFGYPSNVFKVVAKEDGCVYCLRRFDNTKLSNRILATVTERWSCSISHPGICKLHRCFLGQRGAVFFLHDYCLGGAQSINDCFLLGTNTTATNNNNVISEERIIWSYITQLVSILRHVHSNGLACQSLNPSHVLLVGGGNRRLRLSCCGVMDALEFEARKTVQELQQDDLVNLGRLILSMATGTKITAMTNVPTLRSCEAFILQKFSTDLHRLVMALLTSGNGAAASSSSSPGLSLTIFSVCTMMSNHAWEELEVAHTFSDAYSDELARCYENSRALRLLIKLGVINERPEFGMDAQWSETGDRYVLKLFRDYVFHQAHADGSPVLDLGHIITSLNKLDAADPEKIVLVSRDGASLLVVSYADISRCVEEAYNELCNADSSSIGGGVKAPPAARFDEVSGSTNPALIDAGGGKGKTASRFSHHHPTSTQLPQNIYTQQQQQQQRHW